MRLDDSDRVPLIVATVCEVLHAEHGDVYGRDQHWRPAMVRHIAWAAVWMFTNWTPTQIATHFDRSLRGIKDGVRPFLNRDGARLSVAAHDAFVAVLRECEFQIGRREALMTEALR